MDAALNGFRKHGSEQDATQEWFGAGAAKTYAPVFRGFVFGFNCAKPVLPSLFPSFFTLNTQHVWCAIAVLALPTALLCYLFCIKPIII